MKVVLCILFFFLPLSAAAQEASPRDVAALRICVQNYAKNAPPVRVLGGCVGIIKSQCRDLVTTVGLSQCIMREHAAWDHLLNLWWKDMRARAKANGTWDQLLAGQRLWIRQRDAKCQRAYDSAGGGSIRVIYAAECRRDTTAAKVVEFYYSLNR